VNGDLKLGSIILVFSGFLWFYAIPYHIKGSAQALFPKCLTVSMMIPCVLLCIQGFKSYKAGGKQQTSSFVPSVSLRALMVVPLMLAYIFLINIIGFYVTTSLFIFLFMLFFGTRKWLPLCLFPIAIPLVVYVVIRKILSFPFPEGLLF
jgi:putative tricarboxylic transport membrane protein